MSQLKSKSWFGRRKSLSQQPPADRVQVAAPPEETAAAAAAANPVGRGIKALFKAYPGEFRYDSQNLYFGREKPARSSVTGALLAFAAAVLLVLLSIYLYRSVQLLWLIFFGIWAFLAVFFGIFLLRYRHMVRFDRRSACVYIIGRRDAVRFAEFNEIRHFKQTDQLFNGKYRATTLSAVNQDNEELPLITFDKHRVPPDYAETVNRLLWSWLKAGPA
ncbi:MAG: hypothetical protein PHR21_09995 [Oscillospiraceae bacterium]|nr:hypothetical protein [Oscillospiraceae bacterium]MDD4367331.1 hypothetical protein [Oscillospiraceae bacterium]